jgi:hypothetical protein
MSPLYQFGRDLGRRHKAGPGAEPNTQVLVTALRYYPKAAKQEILRGVLDGRREWLRWQTENARAWGARCSKRPARNNHHDSWKAREQYVRGSEVSKSDLMRAARVWEEAYGPGVRSRIQAA